MDFYLRNRLLYLLFTFPARIRCRLHGVKLGNKVSFAGMPFVSKAKGSQISIGDECRFMSLRTGNLLGFNHRCIIASGKPSAEIVIGRNCGFSGVSIWCFKKIVLGNNVRVGANVKILDGDAHQDDSRAGEDKEVIIEDNVWIGTSCLILKGVTIGENSVIGAGSVVVKSIPSNVIAAGNPCRVIRPL